MCDTCRDLEARIEKCQNALKAGFDALTGDRVAELLRQLQLDLTKQVAMCAEKGKG